MKQSEDRTWLAELAKTHPEETILHNLNSIRTKFKVGILPSDWFYGMSAYMRHMFYIIVEMKKKPPHV